MGELRVNERRKRLFCVFINLSSGDEGEGLGGRQGGTERDIKKIGTQTLGYRWELIY